MKAALHLLRGPATMAALSGFSAGRCRANPANCAGFPGAGRGRFLRFRLVARPIPPVSAQRPTGGSRPVRLKPTVLRHSASCCERSRPEAPSKPLLRDLSIDCEILHAPEPEARITLRNDGEACLARHRHHAGERAGLRLPGLLDRFARQNYLDGKSQVAMIEPGIFVRRLEPGRSAVFFAGRWDRVKSPPRP
jgi:hypothetical protein